MKGDTEIDLAAELAQHLSEGQIVVLMGVGAENLYGAFGVSETIENQALHQYTLDRIYRKKYIKHGMDRTDWRRI